MPISEQYYPFLLQRRENETCDEWLLRLGELKDASVINLSWQELSYLLNGQAMQKHSESWWRKRFHMLEADKLQDRLNTIRAEETAESSESEDNPDIASEKEESPAEKNPDSQSDQIVELQKQWMRFRDERYAYNRSLRLGTRQDALLDMFREEIRRFTPVEVASDPPGKDQPKAVCAMLSDIHYGMTFSHPVIGNYDSATAWIRTKKYADAIIREAGIQDAAVCHVVLMGDLISGGNHTTIRIENRENVVEQVVGVSELVSEFLRMLAEKFTRVRVYSVGGNHSRIEHSIDDAMRAERLDSLVPWYCATKLADQKNVSFETASPDDSIISFPIHGSWFVAVHGDLDGNDLEKTAAYADCLTKQPPDYVLGAHLHTPSYNMGKVGIIRNGAVCGVGDEYTVRRRLYGYPCQVFMIVDANGRVSSIHPVRLV